MNKYSSYNMDRMRSLLSTQIMRHLYFEYLQASTDTFPELEEKLYSAFHMLMSCKKNRNDCSECSTTDSTEQACLQMEQTHRLLNDHNELLGEDPTVVLQRLLQTSDKLRSYARKIDRPSDNTKEDDDAYNKANILEKVIDSKFKLDHLFESINCPFVVIPLWQRHRQAVHCVDACSNVEYTFDQVLLQANRCIKDLFQSAIKTKDLKRTNVTTNDPCLLTVIECELEKASKILVSDQFFQFFDVVKKEACKTTENIHYLNACEQLENDFGKIKGINDYVNRLLYQLAEAVCANKESCHQAA